MERFCRKIKKVGDQGLPRSIMENSRPQKCSNCQKEATIHLTQVVGGKANKVSMCATCPFAEVAKSGGAFDLMGQVSPDKANKKALIATFGEGGSCSNCGLTSKDFKETGRLGCSRCYEAFRDRIEPLMAKLHRGIEHIGKSPEAFEERVPEPDIDELREKMQEAVDLEEYEEAAVLRDRIKELEESSG